MTANSWYCIAQTSVFDSGCSIHVAFDGYSIQFSVSVRYGTSSINVSDCNIPSTMKFSVRLREVNKSWFVDLYCNKDIIPTVTIADSLYWSESNAQANAGIILALITDISNKFNPTPGGGSGGLDVNQLQEYLTSNNYITNITLQEAIAPILDWFELKTLSYGSRVLVTKYNLATEKNLGWGGYDGVGSNPGSGASYNRLDSWSAYDETAGDVLSAKLGYGLKTSIENIEQTLGSGLLSKVTVKLGFTDYESVDGVVSLPAYPTIPTKLSAFTDDVGYAKQSDVEAISLRLDNFLVASDTDTIINKWHELEAFLAGQSESSTLAELLGIKADKSVVEALSNRVTANEGNITSLQEDLTSVENRVTNIEDWFEVKTLSDGSKQLVTKYHLATQKGLTWGGNSGQGSSSSSTSYNRLDTWDGYTDSMAGYILSAGLGYELKQAIDNISSNTISKVTVKLGSVAYDSVNGVVSLPAYPTIPTVPTKLSDLIDDLVAGNYLPLTGGILSGALSVPNINITSGDTIAHLAFARQGGNFITAPAGGYIAFIPGGQSIATANADLVITDGIVYPGTTGVTKLGFGDKRWSQVSSVNGDFSGALTAGTFSTANVVSCGGRLRINASNSVTSFGFLKATAYTASLNRAVLDIGSNYGGSSDITSEAVDVVAMSMYRGAVGVGRAFTYDELYANRASNVMLSVEGNALATGSITAASFNGNATSATKLATARLIYGQTFDGQQDITSAKVINFTDAESYSANESGAARVGRFDTNGGLKIQLGNSDDAVIEIVNKGATIALLRMDASGNLRVKGNLIVEGNLTWGGAL